MIMIDIPEPNICDDCPCSYVIQTGEHEGRMMCNAMEFKDISDGFHEEIRKYFVTGTEHRPDGCPIRIAN